MSKIQKFLCKKGFHPETELCFETESKYYLGQERIYKLKCNACGKVFQTYKLKNYLNIVAW